MNRRAFDLAVSLRSQRASVGPGVRSLSVHEFLSWTLIQIGVVSDDPLQVLAVDLGLERARTSGGAALVA